MSVSRQWQMVDKIGETVENNKTGSSTFQVNHRSMLMSSDGNSPCRGDLNGRLDSPSAAFDMLAFPFPYAVTHTSRVRESHRAKDASLHDSMFIAQQ